MNKKIYCLIMLCLVVLAGCSKVEEVKFNFETDCSYLNQSEEELENGVLNYYIMDMYNCTFNNESVSYFETYLINDDEVYNKQFIMTVKSYLRNNNIDNYVGKINFYNLNKTLIDNYKTKDLPIWFDK